MINSIMLGEAIFNALNTNTELAEYVGTKIFPLIAEIDTTFPYVVFSKESVIPNYTKDYNVEDSCSFQVIVADTDYLESLKIANIIRSIFENKGKILSTNDLKIVQCLFSNITEAYDDTNEAFIQRLYFNCKVQ